MIPPLKEANFTWDYQMKEIVDLSDELVKEQGFRIIGNVMVNWRWINFQLFSNKSEKLLQIREDCIRIHVLWIATMSRRMLSSTPNTVLR